MARRALIPALLILAFPALAMAQGTEQYLPSGSQIFLQIDSFQKTKAAYERTVQGKMMRGDTGKALKGLYAWALEAGEAAAAMHEMPTKEDIALIKDGLQLIERVGAEGMALGIELSQAWPPEGRIVVVLPKVAMGPANIVKFIEDVRARAREAGAEAKFQVKKLNGRDVNSAELPFVHVDWWTEKDDFILTIGSGEADAYIKQLDAKTAGLAANPTYKKLLEVGDFPTRSRSFVDVPSIARTVDNVSPEAARTVDELGLRGLGAIFSISGYDGPAQRTLTEMETIGARKGLLAAMSHTKISLKDLPPLPSDMTTFSAGNTNSGKVYDSILGVVENIGRIYVPDQVDNVKAGIKGFEDIIGVDLKKDLFDSFDDLAVQYSSPSEGLLGLGGATLFKVKDEAKLKKAIKAIAAALPQIPGVESSMKKRTFRGVEILEFHANTPGSFTVPSFCVYKGYFAYASYPQQVQGYILRVEGILPSWKVDERLTKALAAFPKEFTGISYSDPQPAVQAVIAAAPMAISVLNGFTKLLPGLEPFDISQIPHAQEATLALFPNLSVTTDDGKKIRIDSRASIGN